MGRTIRDARELRRPRGSLRALPGANAGQVTNTNAHPDLAREQAVMNPTEDTAVRKLARIRAQPGRADALRTALQHLEAETRREPGCHEFGFYQSLSAPEEFILLEHFADAAALQAHLALPHTLAFFERQLVDTVRAFDIPATR
jgi:quinol monooxygenase YgiN